jgi:hypothetical protein
MKIMEIAPLQTCKCGSALDEYGDRCLGSTASHKTCASNSIRDGLVRIFKHVLQTAKLIGSPTQVESEVQNIVPTLPKLKPFDLSNSASTSPLIVGLGGCLILALASMSHSFTPPNPQFPPNWKQLNIMNQISANKMERN